MSEQANINTESAIARTRRDAVISVVVRILLVASAIIGAIVNAIGHETEGSIVIMVVMTILFLLAGKNAKNQRKIASVGMLIDTGRYDDAETALAESFKSFLLYKSPRLGILQNLAALRHAQRRYREAGRLAAELLQQLPQTSAHRRTLQIMLADCALETNDLPTVHYALSQVPQNLPVRESLKLMELQINYYIRSGAYTMALDQLPMKVELAELLPAEPAAHLQAMLAYAAMKLNQPIWCDWLKRRVMLLTDPTRLVARTPILRELGF